jgi:ABC-type transport system substrate-binding protein
MACRLPPCTPWQGGSTNVAEAHLEAAGFSEELCNARWHRIDCRRHSSRLVRDAARHPSRPRRKRPHSLDIHGIGTTFRSYVACWNLYDRLLTFGRKTLPDGGFSYDHTKIEPELAEDFSLSPDGMSVTFKLRRDATFHDGAPVTDDDVKWSLDRAVTVGGFPTFQMAAGSLKKFEQFVVLDDHTIRVDFLQKDRGGRSPKPWGRVRT